MRATLWTISESACTTAWGAWEIDAAIAPTKAKPTAINSNPRGLRRSFSPASAEASADSNRRQLEGL